MVHISTWLLVWTQSNPVFPNLLHWKEFLKVKQYSENLKTPSYFWLKSAVLNGHLHPSIHPLIGDSTFLFEKGFVFLFASCKQVLLLKTFWIFCLKICWNFYEQELFAIYFSFEKGGQFKSFIYNLALTFKRLSPIPPPLHFSKGQYGGWQTSFSLQSCNWC